MRLGDAVVPTPPCAGINKGLNIQCVDRCCQRHPFPFVCGTMKSPSLPTRLFRFLAILHSSSLPGSTFKHSVQLKSHAHWHALKC